MRKLKSLSFTRKSIVHDTCSLLKAKLKPIVTASDLTKKTTYVGERLFVDSAGLFFLLRRDGTRLREISFFGIEPPINTLDT